MGGVNGGKEGIGAGVVHLPEYVHRRAKGVGRRDNDADGKEGNIEDGELGTGSLNKGNNPLGQPQEGGGDDLVVEVGEGVAVAGGGGVDSVEDRKIDWDEDDRV